MNISRRNLFISAAAFAASAQAAAATRSRLRSLERVPGRLNVIWRSPGRFTKNPDIVALSGSHWMLVYCDTDRHWSEQISRITTLESTDAGKTWGSPRVVAQADRRKGEERWVTPRLSRLRDGRLLIICDHDDFWHYHEDRPPGTWMWESRDDGRTWGEPWLTNIQGIEPDRVVEMTDGTLITGSHMVFKSTRKLSQFTMRSSDGGRTWKDFAMVASDRIHNYCEGANVVLRGGELAHIMRDNVHHGYPSYVAFSKDQGRSWGPVQPLPFSGDRPYALQLSDGRVLVTFRNQLGNTGTHAWIGDLHRDIGYQPGGVHLRDEYTLGKESLHLAGGSAAVTRYVLMPPESFRSDVLFEATVRVAGPQGEPRASFEVGRHGLRVDILTSEIWLNRGATPTGRPQGFPDNVPSTDKILAIDMTKPHAIRLQVDGGRVALSVDGHEKLHWVSIEEFPLRETFFGREKSSGEAWFSSVRYEARNETEPPFIWKWTAGSGTHPDQYQMDRHLVVQANPPAEGKRPDHGYSSWLPLPDGSIYLVDYTNRDDAVPMSHLYSARLSPADFDRASESTA